MKKLSIAEKLAKSTFESDAFQKSWQVHMRAFGPILEPAFVGNYAARIHLTAALNQISRGAVKDGLKKLSAVQKSCETDADYAALFFIIGVAVEQSGELDPTLEYYQRANRYHHRFYLPYMKVAMRAFIDGVYDIAEENYHEAIACLNEAKPSEENRAALASAYGNLCACLTQMHRYEEASAALEESKKLDARASRRLGTEAILCAATGKRDEAFLLLDALAQQTPQLLNDVKNSVERILDGTHPHFHPVAPNEAQIVAFWSWFASNEAALRAQLERKDTDAVFAALQRALSPVMTHLEGEPELGLGVNAQPYTIILTDSYSIGTQSVFAALLARCPETIKANWAFEIER